MIPQHVSDATLNAKRPPATLAEATGLAPVAWAITTAFGVLLLTIAYSGTLSEDFSDLTTGTMAFTGVGDKSVEIAGAIASVVLGAGAGFVAARAKGRDVVRAEAAAPADPSIAPRPFVVVLTCLLALSCVALAVRTILSAWDAEAGSWAWLGAAVVLSLAAIACSRLAKGAPREVLVLVAAQSLLGAGIFALLPAAAPPSDSVTPAAWTTGAVWFAAAVSCCSVFVVGLRTARSLGRGDAPSARRIANGPAIVVSTVALSSAVTVPVVPADGYHFGELVSPSYLADAWGQLPFLDQFPARGLLVNFVPSWISDVMASPNAGLVGLGHAWLTLALVAAAYALASRTLPVGNTVIVTATAAFAASNLIAISDVAMVLALVLLYGISKWRPDLIWAAAALMGVVLIFAAPAQGSAWCAAAAILATLVVASDRRRSLSVVGLLTALLVIVAAFTLAPVRRSLIGAVGYVASQGSVNDQVWGTPWLWAIEAQASTPGASPVLEPIRAAVIPVLAVVGCLVLQQLSRHRLRADALPISLAAIAYIVLQLPRALGRIDPDGISRVGALTLVATGIALPLVASRTNWFRWGRAATLSVLLVVAPLILLDGGLAKVATFASRAASSTDATADGALAVGDGPFGGAMIEPSLRSDYASLTEQLRQFPGARDGLLDLTNNQADFRYLGVGNALSYGAAYNITSRPVEASELERLTAHVPRVALLTSNLAKWHDGGSLGLRTPRLYRWVLDRYVPVQCGVPGEVGFAVWGTTDGTAPTGCVIATSTQQKVDMFETAFSPPGDLGALARSWGSARAQGVGAVLRDRVAAPLTLDSAGGGIDIRLASAPPQDAHDVLTLRLACAGWSTAEVSWSDPAHPTPRSTSVELGGGQAVLPMGAFPSFALRDASLDVHVHLQGTSSCNRDVEATWAEYAPPAG